LYRDKGDEVKAESLHQRALAIREKALGADHPETANSLDNLAVLYYSKDDFTRAEPLFQRALTIREKAFGADHLETARSLHNLALLYRDKEDNSRAEPLLQQALAIREKALGADHPLVAYSLNHLAGLYRAKNDYTRAESLYQRALAIFEKAFGAHHPDIATNLNKLGFLYQAKGDISQAIQFQIRSNNVIEHDLMRNLVVGSEHQKALYLKKTSDYTDRTISLHLQTAPQSSEAKEAALTVILRRKGRNLDAMTTAIETLRHQQTPETQKLLDDYASLAGQISVLTLRGPGKKKPAEHLAYLKELETQQDKLEAEISAKSGEFKAQVTPITLENVQKLIPTDATLVEYAVYRPYNAKNRKFGNSRYAVYLLTHNGNIQFADLGEADLINQIIATFRSILSQKSINVIQQMQPVAQTLDKLVMKPVRALMGNANHLLISPDGALNLIPFSALMNEQGKFLIENYTLTYLTSGRDLLRLAVKIESRQPPLVIADPNYLDGTGPQILGQPLGQLTRLAGAQAEGKQFKAIFSNAVLKTGSEATEQTFKQVARPALVHIATHGYFLEDILPPTDLPPLDQARRNIELPFTNLEQERQANPLLRSMLFFAGANQGGTEDNDGVMTALEAAQLNLWGTKLVTLSACDTGLGDVKNGDGVYGLRRALVLAGSETQMMSLWTVSDQAT
ncbi:MAG TPA: CHAT domain-containing protein, partial [Acidobacteriota bacterium]|nr:CHAT domain-containing protein [Acidobacteriota bacterium]